MKAQIRLTARRMALAVLLTASCSASAFYNPHIGRWVNRDPIDTDGGLNIYAFVENSGPNRIDPIGLQGCGYRCGPTYPGPYPDSLPWYPSPGYVLPERPRASVFSICQRDIIETDKKDRCANNCGGQHQYVEYKHPAPEVGPQWIEGYGFAGRTAPELKFQPNRCFACRRVPRLLQFGSGKGKNGFDATDDEVWDCIKNTPPSEEYDWMTYNCTHWATEATRRCGLDCSTKSTPGPHFYPPWTTTE